jgi:hypothetical protein
MRRALTVILVAVTLLLTLAIPASAGKPSSGQTCLRLMPACVSIQ